MRLCVKSAWTGFFLGAFLVPALGASAPPPPKKAAPARAPAAGDRQLLRGTVITNEGKRYSGALRWGDEEAFWDDLFDASKEDLPYLDRQPEEARPHGEIRFLGFIPIGYWQEGEKGRRFEARFGDIREIRPQADNLVEVIMKSGTRYRLEEGGSNDIGATVHLQDEKGGAVDLDWSRIDRLQFEPPPAGAAERKAPRPAGEVVKATEKRVDEEGSKGVEVRLYGEVTTEAGTFTGFIQWDGQECLATDRLDGN